MQPSTTFSTYTDFHSCPLAEWMVERMRYASLVAGGVQWIKGEFGEEALTRRIAGGDPLKLDEIGATRAGIFVDAI